MMPPTMMTSDRMLDSRCCHIYPMLDHQHISIVPTTILSSKRKSSIRHPRHPHHSHNGVPTVDQSVNNSSNQMKNDSTTHRMIDGQIRLMRASVEHQHSCSIPSTTPTTTTSMTKMVEKTVRGRGRLRSPDGRKLDSAESMLIFRDLPESVDVKLITEIGDVFGCVVRAAVKGTEGKVFGFLYFVHAAHCARALALLSPGDTVLDDRVLRAHYARSTDAERAVQWFAEHHNGVGSLWMPSCSDGDCDRHIRDDDGLFVQ